MQVEARDAPPRAAARAASLVPRDEKGGPAVALHQPRRDDPDHPGVPRVRREHQRPVLRPQHALGQLDRLVQNALVQLLAPRVERLELPRDGGRFGGIVGEQQPQPQIRVVDAAGGVEPRREDEPHVAGLDRFARQARRVDQRAHAGPAGVGQHLEPVAHQDAILAGEGHDVGHGRQGHEVEKMERQVGREAERGHERLRQLERHPRAAEVLVLRGAVDPARVEHGRGGRKDVAGEVVIGHDHVDPRRAGGADGLDGGDAAIARDDEARTHAPRFREAGRAEVVAVAQPVRHERVHGGARAPEHPREQRRRALAIHVVVAVHEDRHPAAHRGRHQGDGRAHVRPGERVAQALELGPQERLGDLRGGEATLHQDGRERLGDAEIGGERRDELRVRPVRERPAGGDHSLAYSSTPQASQPSIEAPRAISARRCVGTAVKQWPQASPWRG